ncbi:cerebellin-3-like [Mercenaria mercenaria]|uniref:cerebellin-3-like n=1 Tax=Mercenaria mercenaria TaxID=6596 RepID=UPI00234E5645|nr:cerebellin-3-like [Mercenaria mercenaria]
MHFFLSPTMFIVIMVTIGQSCWMVAANEPVCSRFDYEEKLLEKMVRTEIKVEQMVEEMKKTKESVATIATDIQQRAENVESNSIRLQGLINDTLTRFAEDIGEEKNKLTALAEKVTPVPVVAFHARRSSTVTVSSGGTVVFDTVLMNEGESYDRATGVFTAPYNGLYYFAAHVCNQGNKDVQYAIVVDNNQLTSSTQYDDNSVYSCSSVNAVVVMKSADRAWIKCTDSSTFYNDGRRWNSFVGSLLNR